jgi:hypothetical protein
MRETHSDLWLCTLDPESHARTCDYWYLVRTHGGTMAHTAFRTRDGLLRWLSERGLSLTEPLPDHGTHSSQRISGTYRRESHYSPDEVTAYHATAATCIEVTREMSNGAYTEARITLDSDGLRTVHFLNPNVRERITFDYVSSNLLLG